MSKGSIIASEHCITHKSSPLRWMDGFPLGNGDFGAMVWGDGNPFAFTLDKADLWDLSSNNDYMNDPDFNYASLCHLVKDKNFDEVDRIFEKQQYEDNPVGPTKISIGRAEINLGKALEYECHLDLGTASVSGVIKTEDTEHEIKAFVYRKKNILCIRATYLPVDAIMKLIPLADMNDSLQKLNHTKPCINKNEGRCNLLQELPGGLYYAVVWNEFGQDFFVAVESALSANEAQTKAEKTWQFAQDLGFDALFEKHKKEWDEFWNESAVYLPEPRIEFLWYYGLYILASSARRGSLPPGLQGIWPMDGLLPPWRGDYHGNINVQEIFWPACASGHIDLLDCWCDMMKDCIIPAQKFTRQFFGTEGTYWPCAFLPKYTLVPCWGPVQYNWSNTGFLCWLVWLRWRYSIDLKWLDETGYLIVSECFKFYRANLVKEEDGLLHIPVSSSPEYRENKPVAWCKDPNIDIALIRRCCDWLVEMEEALGINDLSSSAKEVHQNLVPYHITDKKELCLWADKLVDEAHRHPSHLMAIHPAMDITIEDGEEANNIIDASLKQYFSLGQYLWAGHSYAQLTSFAAVVGRPEFAYDCLNHIAEYWLWINGLHFNLDFRSTGTTHFHGLKNIINDSTPFTIESNCGASAGISDMMVQGWNDIIRVFPAVPQHWRDAAFRDLQTEGAFRVSAVRKKSMTVWVKVTAGVKRQLKLKNPFGNFEFTTSGTNVLCDGNFIIADMDKEQEIIFYLKNENIDFDSMAMSARHSDYGRIGLK